MLDRSTGNSLRSQMDVFSTPYFELFSSLNNVKKSEKLQTHKKPIYYDLIFWTFRKNGQTKTSLAIAALLLLTRVSSETYGYG